MENLVFLIIMIPCAAAFTGIGVYAMKRKKPMWFWSGSDVDASQITDVKRYNQENGLMWQLYSLWYLGAGLAEFWNTIAALILLVLSCTVGIALLIRSYNRIFKKYTFRR